MRETEFRDVLFLVAGMVLGASMVTWGLADNSNLPEKEKVVNWTSEYYREQIVNQDPDVVKVYVDNVTESRFPSMYSAQLVESYMTEGGRTNRTGKIYISKDGLQTGRLDIVKLEESVFR